MAPLAGSRFWLSALEKAHTSLTAREYQVMKACEKELTKKKKGKATDEGSNYQQNWRRLLQGFKLVGEVHRFLLPLCIYRPLSLAYFFLRTPPFVHLWHLSNPRPPFPLAGTQAIRR